MIPASASRIFPGPGKCFPGSQLFFFGMAFSVLYPGLRVENESPFLDKPVVYMFILSNIYLKEV
jgi:hypothetical protein